MPPSLPVPRTANFLSERFSGMVEALLTRREGPSTSDCGVECFGLMDRLNEGFRRRLRDESKRDSSTAQADSFARANEKKRRRLAPLGMTVARWAGLNLPR